jgi:dTDP-4-amino-4,6-dideoxygalactose transaminase
VGTYVHSVVGTNSRLDALQAAVLLVKLKHLDNWVEERRANAAYYDQHFAEIPEVVTPVARDDAYHGFNQYVVRLPRRDDAVALLKERGIGCSVYYPLPLHQQACFAHLGYSESDFPNATQASREVLALPIFPELTHEQQDEVILAVKDHLAAVRG